MQELIEKVKWFKHASISFEDNNGMKYCFIDPFDLRAKNYRKADLVFISHAHYDHCSKEDFEKIRKTETKVVAPKDCLQKLGIPENNSIEIKPGQEKKIQGIKVKAIPAYNIKPERLTYNPRTNNWVGYIIQLNKGKIYHAGDTDFTPEMRQLKDIDLAMLPIGGTYTMTVEEAIEAANTIKAKITTPIHYRRLLEETYEKAEKLFQEKVKGKTIIMKELL